MKHHLHALRSSCTVTRWAFGVLLQVSTAGAPSEPAAKRDGGDDRGFRRFKKRASVVDVAY
jgi:hypothetical protein